MFGDSIRENDTVAHIGELLAAAKKAGITVAVSPHYFYPTDKQWTFGDPLEQFMSAVGMFGRLDAYTTDGFAGSGADFLPEYHHHIHDGHTVIASPHKIVGPESNDLVLQLRKRGVSQVVVDGLANLCVEGHLRELVEQGFEVAVVKDADLGRPTTPRRRRLPGRAGQLPLPRQCALITADAVALFNKQRAQESEDHDIYRQSSSAPVRPEQRQQ